MLRFKLLFLKLGISLSLLYIAINQISLKALADQIVDIHIGWMIAALAPILAQVALGALRWWFILSALGVKVRYIGLLRFTAIGAFFNQALPSTIGGDAMRAWLLRQQLGSWLTPAHSVFIDRFIGMVGLAGLAMVTTPIGLLATDGPPPFWAALTLAVSVLFAAFLFLCPSLISPIQRIGQRPLTALQALSHDTVAVLCALRTGAVTIALSLMIHILTFVILAALNEGLGGQVDLSALAITYAAVLLVSMVPISIAGWGLRESAMIVGLPLLGVAKADALLLSIWFGLALSAGGLVGGLAWFIGGPRLAWVETAKGEQVRHGGRKRAATRPTQTEHL